MFVIIPKTKEDAQFAEELLSIDKDNIEVTRTKHNVLGTVIRVNENEKSLCEETFLMNFHQLSTPACLFCTRKGKGQCGHLTFTHALGT